MNYLAKQWVAMFAVGLGLLAASCNEARETYTADAGRQPVYERPQLEPPPDQEVSVNLIYSGETDDAGKVGFDFRVLWGEYKNSREELTMASRSPGSAQFDLGFVETKVLPVFPGGQEGHYKVRMLDKSGSLMGEFDITGTGKQVKPSGAATPGYSQRMVFYDRTRYLTCYRLQEQKGSSLGKQIGVIFIGQGWEAVDASKSKVVEGKYDFPKVDMVVLPHEWMEYNDINLAQRGLKRGRESVAGVCYSCCR